MSRSRSRQIPQAAAPPWALPAAAAALGLLLLISYASPLAELVRRWSAEADYSHGFLVPLVSLALLWVRRGQLAGGKLTGSWWGLAWVGGSLLLRLMGEYYYYASLHALSLLPALAGVCLFVGGRRLLVWAAPSIGFLIFMIPLPEVLRQGISLPLQRLSTVLSAGVLQMLGQPAIAEGNTLLIRDFRLEVVAACSGLRLLVMLAALITAYILFVARPWRERWVLIACMLPVAVLANVARLTSMGLFYQEVSTQRAQQLLHDSTGFIMIPLALGMIVLLNWYARRLLTPAAPLAQTADTALAAGLEVAQTASRPDSELSPAIQALAKRLNLPLLRRTGILVVGLLVVLSLVRFLQMRGNALELWAEAEHAEAQRDWPQASQKLAWYLQIRPDDVAARVRLAELHEKTAGTPQRDLAGVEIYRRAIAVAPHQTNLRRRYVDLLLMLGRYVDAQREATRLLAVAPKDATGLRVLALSRYFQSLASEQPIQAELIQLLEAAAHANPSDTALMAAWLASDPPVGKDSLTELVHLFETQPGGNQGIQDWAMHLASDTVAQRPASVSDRVSLAMLLAAGGHAPEAEAAIRSAMQTTPDDVRCHLALVAILQHAAKPAEARAAVESFKRTVQVAEDLQDWMLAQAYSLLGDRAQAREYYLIALNKRPHDELLQQQLIGFLTSGPVDQLEQSLRETWKQIPQSILVRQALALQLSRRGDEPAWQEALSLAQEDSSPSGKRLLARLLLDHGGQENLDQARSLLEQLTAQQAVESDRFLLARAHLLTGRETESLAILRSLVEAPRPAAQHVCAYLDLLLKLPPKQESPALETLLTKLNREFSGEAEILVRLATIRFSERRVAEATRLYRSVLRLAPQNVTALNNLSLLLSESPAGQREAQRLLASAESIAGRESPQLQDTRAVVMLRSGDPQGAVQHLTELLKTVEAPADSWLHLAIAYEQLGEREQAKAALAKVVSLNSASQWLAPAELEQLGRIQ